ncbi:glycoside hydrolase [bacterium]|nr:glycoside hydrolase [bacterium]
MSIDKLFVSFLWHFHQPYYKDLLADEYVMPWVRLHALKDYYDMGRILGSVDGARAVFNFVPSLLAQLNDYAGGTANDTFLRLTERDADGLGDDERMFIIQSFFHINHKIIGTYPRYVELLAKRESVLSDGNTGAFGVDDLRDLQVLFNLAWSGNTLRSESDIVKELEAKGRDFSEDEKMSLLDAQQSFLSRTGPLYSSLVKRGAVELSTTPFYHPILPLIQNVKNARKCMPNAPLPEKWTGAPDDAVRHAKDAVELFKSVFDVPLRGMWPAEGSVSQDTCYIYKNLGMKWIATDEMVLFRSMAESQMKDLEKRAARLYSPFFVEIDGSPLSVFFRDHLLSDSIGFVYSSWEAEAAVDDFISKLKGIFDVVRHDADMFSNDLPPVVSVILDGENAWQFFPENGEPFLRALYSMLSKTDWIEPTTFGDYVEKFGPGRKLDKLASGSWIRGDFGVWIGHSEDNKAWDYVAAAREALVQNPPKDEKENELAWQSLMAAEGSDWNWWYGDDHQCDNIADFDRLFRKHIANVFSIIGKQPPFDLSIPIKSPPKVRLARQPRQFLQPVLDGKDTRYYEWLSAGMFDQQSGGRGAMHQVSALARRLYFGFDPENLYIRIDFMGSAADVLAAAGEMELVIDFTSPSRIRLGILPKGESGSSAASLAVLSYEGSEWRQDKMLDSVAIDQIVELSAPLAVLGCKPGDRLEFAARLLRGGSVLESIPEVSAIETLVPSRDFEEEEWCV